MRILILSVCVVGCVGGEPGTIEQSEEASGAAVGEFLDRRRIDTYVVRLDDGGVMRALEILEIAGPYCQLDRTVQADLVGLVEQARSDAISLQTQVLADSGIESDRIAFRYTDLMNALAVQLTAEEARRLTRDDRVAGVEPSGRAQATTAAGLEQIRAHEAWSLEGPNGFALTGHQVTIAVIDSGVDYRHPDIAPNYLAIGHDFVDDDNDPMDELGHGTHVASIAAGTGIVPGVAPGAQIISYRVLDERGEGSGAAVIAALDRATDPNRDGLLGDCVGVVNLSLSVPRGPGLLAEAAAALMDFGVVVVASAGNFGADGAYTVASPANAEAVIAVGANGDSAD